MSAVRHIHLDAVGGVAGDMFVAAMLDAFPGLTERVLADLAAVLPRAAGAPELAAGESGGVRALRFGLAAAHRGHPHEHDHHHDHHHGLYRDLVARIRGAPLSPGTADRACAILGHVAEAEARIHGVPVDEVHFHEIGDWDSLMDVVAAGSLAAALPDARWSVSPLPLGGGLVRTAHGLLPVPAPATVEMLRGFEWRNDGIEGERVTPTGAAILRALVDPAAAPPRGRLAASGSGAGTRTLPGMPNVLRVLAFETAGAGADPVAVLAFDIDDMTGEEIGVAADRLRALDGVLDVAVGALSGKKGRPLSAFRLLVRPDALDAVRTACFSETSTIGLRWHVEERAVLARSAATAGVGAAAVRLKRVARPGGATTAKAESDDLAAIAGLRRRRSLKARAEGEP